MSSGRHGGGRIKLCKSRCDPHFFQKGCSHIGERRIPEFQVRVKLCGDICFNIRSASRSRGVRGRGG